MQNSEGDAWPAEHWRENKGRWRLYTPAIDAHLNQTLFEQSFGEGVEYFALVLEIADFARWGGPPAFTPAEGRVTYKPSQRELWSVGQLDWLEIQSLTPTQQLREYQRAAVAAIDRVSVATRKPKHFSVAEFSTEVARLLQCAKVSALKREAHHAKLDA